MFSHPTFIEKTDVHSILSPSFFSFSGSLKDVGKTEGLWRSWMNSNRRRLRKLFGQKKFAPILWQRFLIRTYFLTGKNSDRYPKKWEEEEKSWQWHKNKKVPTTHDFNSWSAFTIKKAGKSEIKRTFKRQQKIKP